MSSVAAAQQGPPPAPLQPKQPAQPVDASTFEVPGPKKALGLVVPDPNNPNAPQAAPQVAPPPSYHSPTLGANFLAQWMQLTLANGQTFQFWGARVVSLDRQSPLHALGLRRNDVVTRLDDIKISDNFFDILDPVTRAPVTQLPEMERHFGTTDVRYIFHGTHHVNVGQIVLNPTPVTPNGAANGLVPIAP